MTMGAAPRLRLRARMSGTVTCSVIFGPPPVRRTKAAGGQSAVITSWGENAQEVVPSTSGANFDHIASHVGGRGACLAPELAKVSQREPAWREAWAECECHVHEPFVLADRTFGFRFAPEVLRDPEQLWLGVAHVGTPEATPSVLLHYRLTHQPVLDAAGTRKSADSPTRLRSAP